MAGAPAQGCVCLKASHQLDYTLGTEVSLSFSRGWGDNARGSTAE